MNIENLHRLIDRYEEKYYEINNEEHYEIFKWKAMKRFRDVWFSNDYKDMLFSEKFKEAKKDFSILMDNKSVSPSTGIVKIAEKNQEAVEHLFNDVLFSNDGGDIRKRQNNVDLFIEGINNLCKTYFPQSYKYKQERHSALCYLFFFSPETNYIYRHTEANTFAQFIEFGKDIGSGQEFRLDYYYEMCDRIVEALKEHKTLLEKHYTLLNESCYRDDSLHLLAFDIIYCSNAYYFFEGMTHASKKEVLKAFTEAQLREKERLAKEEHISSLKREIQALKMKKEQYDEISLVGIEINHTRFGKGIVVDQVINSLKVQFEDRIATLCIRKEFAQFLKFDDDENLIEIMTDYEDVCNRIEELEFELKQAEQ